MKINPINHSDAVSKRSDINANPYAETMTAVEINDSLELSEGAQKYSELIKTAKISMEESETDEETVVSDIIARMNNNSYEISDEDVINNILGGTPSKI